MFCFLSKYSYLMTFSFRSPFYSVSVLLSLFCCCISPFLYSLRICWNFMCLTSAKRIEKLRFNTWLLLCRFIFLYLPFLHRFLSFFFVLFRCISFSSFAFSFSYSSTSLFFSLFFESFSFFISSSLFLLLLLFFLLLLVLHFSVPNPILHITILKLVSPIFVFAFLNFFRFLCLLSFSSVLRIARSLPYSLFVYFISLPFFTVLRYVNYQL